MNPELEKEFDERFVTEPDNTTKSGRRLICDPEYAKAFLIEKLAKSIAAYAHPDTREAAMEALSSERERVRSVIAEMMANVPFYPMEGPSSQTITWAARHAYGEALTDLLAALYPNESKDNGS